MTRLVCSSKCVLEILFVHLLWIFFLYVGKKEKDFYDSIKVLQQYINLTWFKEREKKKKGEEVFQLCVECTLAARVDAGK